MPKLADLMQICPPPPASDSVDWEPVESDLGVTLPADYKQLSTVYGPGNFCEYVSVYHPYGPTEWVDLLGPMPANLRRQLREDREGGAFPVAHDPEKLLACGVTDNGEHVFWVTEPADQPDSWRIAVNEARGPGWYTFDGGLVAFLAAVFSGRIDVPLFPDNLLDDGVGFSAHSARKPRVPGSTDLEPNAARAAASRVVRAWARATGYDLPDRGRIPAAVIEAWEQATIRPS
jgi:hypothetical protein